jgi:protein-L-isoaspartate O-methyltransferase
MLFDISQKVMNFMSQILSYFRAFQLLFWTQGSFVYSTGWLESLADKHPRTKKGYTIPWMNYAVIHLLKQRLTQKLTLFEYGSGYSTLFYARLVQHVTSVEYDHEWFALLNKKIPKNVDLHFQIYVPDGDYSRAIQSTKQKYDVLVVDGRDRVRCILYGLDCLTESGVVILDDSQRSRYSEALAYLKENNFQCLDLIGIKPGTSAICQTTIAYRAHNCLGL